MYESIRGKVSLMETASFVNVVITELFNQAGEPCAWCHSGSSGDSCMKQSDAEGLPTSVFQCKYQAYTEAAILGIL